jgi:hypothetical protein
MSYRTLMATSIPGRANAAVLEATAAIAGKLHAGVLGIAACRPIHCVSRDYALPAVAFEHDRKQIERQIHDAEREFRATMAGLAGSIEWRAHTCLEPLATPSGGGIGFGRPDRCRSVHRWPRCRRNTPAGSL